MNKKIHSFLKILANNPISFFAILIIFLVLTALPLRKVILQVPSAQAFSVLGESDEVEDEDNDEDENEDEDEVEDEDNDENEDKNKSNETEEKVENPNGTTSTIERHTEDGDGKIKIKTYNTNGVLIEEKEYESDDEEVKIKIKQFDEFGNKLLELKYKNNEGEEIKLQIEESDTGKSKIRYDFENQKLFVKIESEEELEDPEEENELEIEVEDDTFRIKHKNSVAYVNFPIIVDEETGTVYVTTKNGKIELKNLPDVVVQKALESEEIEEISKTSLDNEDENLKYLIEGEKKEQLLGFLDIDISKILVYDAETGELIDISIDPFTRILDFLSF